MQNLQCTRYTIYHAIAKWRYARRGLHTDRGFLKISAVRSTSTVKYGGPRNTVFRVLKPKCSTLIARIHYQLYLQAHVYTAETELATTRWYNSPEEIQARGERRRRSISGHRRIEDPHRLLVPRRECRPRRRRLSLQAVQSTACAVFDRLRQYVHRRR